MRIQRHQIELNTPYWICDEAIASKDNVWEYVFTYPSEISEKADYAVFEAKAEALAHSQALD